jgi:hypothetical protein
MIVTIVSAVKVRQDGEEKENGYWPLLLGRSFYWYWENANQCKEGSPQHLVLIANPG